MRRSAARSIMGPVGRLFGGEGTVAGLDDDQLLERFVARRDDVAFEAIVGRHGPMVMGVCRRLLGNDADVDDAFQAVFLVLARRASSVRDPGRLSPWLYGVARKVALRAKKQAIQRHTKEHGVRREFGVVSAGDEGIEAQELASVLDQELERLPEKYRTPLVLCYLEGLSHDEAARRLRWPVGTVRSRMAGGRDRLRRRLVTRGIAAPSALLAAESMNQAVEASALSSSTIARTVQSVVAFYSSPMNFPQQPLISGSIVFLAQGVLKAMMIQKAAWCAGFGAMVVGLIASGAGGYVLSRQDKGDGRLESLTVQTGAGASAPGSLNQDKEALIREQREIKDKLAELNSRLATLDAKLESLNEGSGGAATPKASSAKKAPGRNSKNARAAVRGGVGMGPGMGMGGGGGGFGGQGGGGMGGMGGGVGGGIGGGGMGGGRMGGIGGGGMGGGRMGGMGGMMAAMMGGGGAGVTWLQAGETIAIHSPQKDKVTVYDGNTGEWETYRAPQECEISTSISPNGQLVYLSTTGTKIPELAVFSLKTHSWSKHTLKHPFDGSITPLVSAEMVAFIFDGEPKRELIVYAADSNTWHSKTLDSPAAVNNPLLSNHVAVFVAGSKVYAFSASVEKWAELELPEGATPEPSLSFSSAIVAHGEHLYIFRADKGTWIDIDQSKASGAK